MLSRDVYAHLRVVSQARTVAARIQRAVSEFGSGPATDDMALLVLRAL